MKHKVVPSVFEKFLLVIQGLFLILVGCLIYFKKLDFYTIPADEVETINWTENPGKVKYKWETDTFYYKLTNNLVLEDLPPIDTCNVKAKVLYSIIELFFEENKRLFESDLIDRAVNNQYIDILYQGEDRNLFYYSDKREDQSLYTIHFKDDFLVISSERNIPEEINSTYR